VIALYLKNLPRSGELRCDYVHVLSERPPVMQGYRRDGAHLVSVVLPPGYLARFRGWYHPATAWEIEVYRRLGGAWNGQKKM